MAKSVMLPGFDRAKLIALRKAHGWTRSRLAAEVGMVFRTIEAWESGQRTPTPAHLVRLARVLEVRPGELLTTPAADWTLSEHRVMAGLQQKELARALGLNIERLRHIENGVNALPADVADQLAAAFAISEPQVRAAWQRAREQLTA